MPVSSRRSFTAAVCTVLLAVCLLPLPVNTQDGRAVRRFVRIGRHLAADGEVLVKFRTRPVSALARAQAQTDAEVVETAGTRGVRRLRSAQLGTQALLDTLRNDPDVEYVEPNYVVQTFAVPNDSSFGSLWGLLNTGANPVGGGGVAGADIDAETAWNTTTGSRSLVVGVIDTGVDYTHPDLTANMWAAPSSFSVSIGGQTITCAAGTHGFNAITRTCNPMDDQYHGTHAAGTIGATGNNGTGVTGVAWLTSIMGLKFMNAQGQGLTSDAVAAVDFARQVKALFPSTANVRILNNSWGGTGYSQTLADAIAAANTADILFVAAAGNSTNNNDSTPIYPASHTEGNVMAVASSTSADALSSFSNYGNTSVDLAAPGSSIVSTLPHATYGILSGTSMAAPHVSGAAALLLSMCTLTTAQLKARLMLTVDVRSAFVSKTSTGGRLNVGRAIDTCPYPRITNLTLTPSAPSPQAPNTAITWTATPTGGQAPYQYQWLVYNGSTWSTPTDWSTSNTYSWTPTAASSSYQVAVRARSAWNTGSRDYATSATYVIQPMVTALSLTPNVASPRGLGTTVTWTASASGGQAPYQYQWLVYNGSTWSAPTSWSTSNTYSWTPTSTGSSYQVAVRARSAWNSGNRERATSASYAILPVVSSFSIAPNVASPRAPNTTITWTATASGGQAPYQYQWLIYNGASWSAPTDWSSSATFSWTPSSPSAGYQVAARVRSAWNSGTREMATAQAYVVMPLITSLSLTPSAASPQPANTPITWTASASGGQAPYQYQWLVYNGSTWSAPTAWSTSHTYVWTPTSTGSSYQIAVRARSAWNSGSRDAATAQSFVVQ